MLVTGGLDPLWEATVAAGADGVAASNVIANRLVGAGVDPAVVDASELARLVDARERIPRKAFDEAIARVGEPGFTAEPYLARGAVSDTASLEPIVDAILAANPAQVEEFRGGKDGLLVLRGSGDEGDEGAGRRARRQRARACQAHGVMDGVSADTGISLDELRLAARNRDAAGGAAGRSRPSGCTTS